MAKKYKVKDINNNGKIDGWEQGKYDAINNSATKMGYSMKMGAHSQAPKGNSLNFSDKDSMNMAKSYVMNQGHSTDKNDPLADLKKEKDSLKTIQQNAANNLYNQIMRDSMRHTFSGSAEKFKDFNVFRNPDAPLQGPSVSLPNISSDDPYASVIKNDYNRILTEAGMKEVDLSKFNKIKFKKD